LPSLCVVDTSGCFQSYPDKFSAGSVEPLIRTAELSVDGSHAVLTVAYQEGTQWKPIQDEYSVVDINAQSASLKRVGDGAEIKFVHIQNQSLCNRCTSLYGFGRVPFVWKIDHGISL